MKKLIIALVASVTATSVLLVLGSAGTAATRQPKQPAKPAKPRPVKADRDHDKLFDDLEARLPSVQDGDEVDVIVTLDAPASAARIAELGRRIGQFRTTRRFAVVDGFAAHLTKAQVAELAQVPWVEHVEANAVVRALNDSAATSFGVAKAQADLPGLDGDADGSAAVGPGDLVAAVIDTGVDARHLDLDEGKVIAFKDFVNGRADAYDDNGHGTHVASTIAGDGDARADRLHRGVAPGAGLVGLKVLDAAGSGTMANVTAAIDWVVQNEDIYGIEAINLSLGVAGCSDGTDATSQAVERAVAAGLVVAAAAGNEGPGACTIGSPGAAASALTVGAMADLGAGGFHQAVFSSRGPTAGGRVKPDISAPGVDVTAAAANSTNGYATFDGTSMATPFVAGLALLMREANPALTPAQVKDAVRSTAVDWGRAGPDSDYGAGRLDGYAALRAAGAALTMPPATPRHELREGSLPGSGASVDYSFYVADTRYPLAATLLVPASGDFDLYLYAPNGTLVGFSERVARQEEVFVRAPSLGSYRVRVYSYGGSGGFVLDVSAGIGDPPAAPVTSFPGSTTLFAGSLRGGTASRLNADDNAYFQVNSTTSGTRQADWYGRVTGVSNAVRSLSVAYRGKSSATCDQTVWIYNWTTSTWAQLDRRNVGTTEVAVSATVAGMLAEYVSGTSGAGEVAVRVRCLRTDGTGFYVSGDRLAVTHAL